MRKLRPADKNVLAVFIGAVVSMVLSCVALHNAASNSGACAVTSSFGKQVHVQVGSWK